jgi:hypothetical protein
MLAYLIKLRLRNREKKTPSPMGEGVLDQASLGFNLWFVQADAKGTKRS